MTCVYISLWSVDKRHTLGYDRVKFLRENAHLYLLSRKKPQTHQ